MNNIKLKNGLSIKRVIYGMDSTLTEEELKILVNFDWLCGIFSYNQQPTKPVTITQVCSKCQCTIESCKCYIYSPRSLKNTFTVHDDDMELSAAEISNR